MAGAGRPAGRFCLCFIPDELKKSPARVTVKIEKVRVTRAAGRAIKSGRLSDELGTFELRHRPLGL